MAMKKYIIIYKAPMTAAEQMAGSGPEEGQKGMELWMEWAKKCGNALVDLGTPLGNSQIVTPTMTLPGDEKIIGYSILQAERMADAEALIKDHPHLKWNASCTIEIHEALPLPQ